MKFSILPSARIALCGAALAVLASCGGSGGGDDNGNGNNPPPASNTPPASASANVSGFIAYLQTLVPTKPNTTEPLDVASFVAPRSDNTEPDTSF